MLRCHSLYKANYSFRPAGSFNIICCQTATQFKQCKSNFWCNSAIYHQRSSPFSVVKNSGFQNLNHILEPRYTIPSKQHFSDKALLELYEQKKTELKSEFAEAVAVALTTDGSTSLATESYLTITCNYTVPFKSKLTVRCESRFLTRFAILDSCANRESSQGSSLAGQKTKDSPMIDFSISLQRHKP